jgi:D-threo-aldose 1-dehydrogenase
MRDPIVVNVTLGMRTAEEVARNTELHRRHVPEALWDDLRDRGLISPGVPAAHDATGEVTERDIGSGRFPTA